MITGVMKRVFDGTEISVPNELRPRRVRSIDPMTMIATDNVGWKWRVPLASPAEKELGVVVEWIPGDPCGLSDSAAILIVKELVEPTAESKAFEAMFDE